MTTPNLSLSELVASQSQPHIPINTSLRILDAVVQLSVIDLLESPPASPEEGDRYVVDADPSGDWVDYPNHVSMYSGGAWVFVAPQPGWIAYVRTMAAFYSYDTGSPSAWYEMDVGGAGAGFATVVTEAGTARTLSVDDAGCYIRMTSTSANSVEVPPNSLEAFEIGDEVHVRQAGSGSTSISAGAGVTLNGGLTLTGQHATATIKKVAINTWDVFGSVS